MDPEDRRQERLAPLSAMDAALADPVRLVTVLVDAEDDEDALRRVRDTFGLTDEQMRRYRDVTVVASVPVTNAAGRLIGVVSGSSTSDTSALATSDGLEAQIFLAQAAARVLVDLLKWFSDGYDDLGEKESAWSAR